VFLLSKERIRGNSNGFLLSVSQLCTIYFGWEGLVAAAAAAEHCIPEEVIT